MTALLATVDGRVMPIAEATIPVTDPGFVRGDAVFEVARVYDGRPFALDEHLERMRRSAERMRLELDIDLVRADLIALLAAAPDDYSGLLRMIVTREGRRIGTMEIARDSGEPVVLCTLIHTLSPVLDQVKSVSYAANMLAGRIAAAQGAEDALFVSPDGRVLEGPTFSIFMRFAGQDRWVTPPLSDYVLDSITRRAVFAVLGDQAREERVDVGRLAEVEEAFLASTVREARPVGSIDGRVLPQAPGAATLALRDELRAYITARAAAEAGR